MRRAQQGGRQVVARAPARGASVSAPVLSQYPVANVETLALLGQIDALLKAPPQPPRWALLRALSILEENASK